MRPVLWTAAVLLVSACTGGESGSGPPDTSVASGATWTALPDAPSERTEVAAAVSGAAVVVAGGLRADGGSLTTVEIFDTRARTWAAGPPLPLAVNHAMAASVDGAVYVFGGYLADGTPSAAAFRLDLRPAAESAGVSAGPRWRSVADLPSARAAGASAVIGGRVYLAGGIGPGKDSLADASLVYSPEADHWTTTSAIPTRREHLGGAAAGGLFYTVGGRTATGGNMSVVESFDPATGAWTRRPDLPTARGGLAATASCTGVVIAAGGEGQRTFPQVEAYYPSGDGTGRWRSFPPMPTPRHGLGLVTVGATLYSLPGGPQPGLHVGSTTEALDLSFLGPCP